MIFLPRGNILNHANFHKANAIEKVPEIFIISLDDMKMSEQMDIYCVKYLIVHIEIDPFALNICILYWG